MKTIKNVSSTWYLLIKYLGCFKSKRENDYHYKKKT